MECFSVLANEVEDRIDPLFYASDVFQVLKNSKFKILSIEDISEYIKTGFPAGASLQSHDKTKIVQIRPTNINRDNLLYFDRNIHIKDEVAKEKINDLLKKGEVLFNNTNSQDLVGKTSYFDKDGKYFCSNHITRIKVKEDLVLPKYLWILFNQYQRNKVFFVLCTNWNNQSGINLDLLKSIKIPVPSISKQKEIISFYERALNKKINNEKESERLFDSINNYVLTELNIATNNYNTKYPKIFEVNFEQISNSRIDPNYHRPDFMRVVKIMGQVNIDKKTIREISESVHDGLREKRTYVESGGILLIRATNLKKGNIDLSNIKYITSEKHEQLRNTSLKENDILITILGTIGSTAVVPKELDGSNISAAIARIRIKKDAEVNPHYVNAFLKTELSQKLIKREVRTSVQEGLNLEQVKDILIPIPNISIQNRIADEVKRRMQKAEHLKKEANKELEIGKLKVEKIIMG